MSEAPGGGPDSRPGEDPPAREGQAPQGDSYSWYRRGLDLLGRGSPAAAAQLLERAAEAEPGARSVREALARAQFDAGRYTQAAASFRQIVEAIPSDDYAQFGLGLALARSGDPAAAAEHLALAAAMRPDLRHYTDALRGVRATLRAQGEAQPPAGRGGAPSPAGQGGAPSPAGQGGAPPPAGQGSAPSPAGQGGAPSPAGPAEPPAAGAADAPPPAEPPDRPAGPAGGERPS